MPPLAPRPGSSLYYAALYCDEDTRIRTLRTLNLNAVIANSLADVQEPAVAQQKIHWWHEELDRLDDNAATHPTLAACQTIHDNTRLKKHCLAILSAAANERMTPATNGKALAEQLTSDYSARGMLLLDGLYGEPAPDEIAKQVVPNLAKAYSHSDRLRQIRHLLHRGIPVFSNEYYEKFDLEPTALIEHITSDEGRNEKIDALLTDAVDLAAAAYADIDNLLPISMVKDEPKLLPVLTLTRLRHQQINLWQKQRPDLLKVSLTPTPVRKFWLAWRCMRQAR